MVNVDRTSGERSQRFTNMANQYIVWIQSTAMRTLLFWLFTSHPKGFFSPVELCWPTVIHRTEPFWPFLLCIKAARWTEMHVFPRHFYPRTTELHNGAVHERFRSRRRWNVTGVGLPVEPLWICPVPLCGHTELHTSSFPFCLFQKTTPRLSAGRTASKSAVCAAPSQKRKEGKVGQEWKRGGAEKEKQ